MRNFKKFLALVLAMLMVSACAVSVSAAYGDQAAIDASGFSKAVAMLTELGVVKGDGENFRPDDTLRRDEAAVMAAKLVAGAKGQTYDWTAATCDFTDVEAAWSFAYINYVGQKGIMQGDGTGFAPERVLQIDEAIKIAVVATDAAEARKAFEETEQYKPSYWATYWISAADRLDLLNGVDVFNYKQPCSRAMFAQIIYNAFENNAEIKKNFGYYNIDASVAVKDGIVTLTNVAENPDPASVQVTVAYLNEALAAAGYTETAADLTNSRVNFTWFSATKKIVAVKILTTDKTVLYNDEAIKFENVYSDMNGDGKVETGKAVDFDPRYLTIGGVKYQVGVKDGKGSTDILGATATDTVGIALTLNGTPVKAGEVTNLPTYFKAFLYDDNGDGDFERCDMIEYAIATVKKTAASASDKADLYTVKFIDGTEVVVNKDEKTAAKWSGKTVVANDETPMLIAKNIKAGDTIDIIEEAAVVTGKLTAVAAKYVKIGDKSYEFVENKAEIENWALNQNVSVYTIGGKYVKFATVSYSDIEIVVNSAVVKDGKAVITGYNKSNNFAEVEIIIDGINNGKLVSRTAAQYVDEDANGKEYYTTVAVGYYDGDDFVEDYELTEGTIFSIRDTADGNYINEYVTSLEALGTAGSADKFEVKGGYVYLNEVASMYFADGAVVLAAVEDAKANEGAYNKVTYNKMADFSVRASVDYRYLTNSDGSKVTFIYVEAGHTATSTETVSTKLADGQSIVYIKDATVVESTFDNFVYNAIDLMSGTKVTITHTDEVEEGHFYVVKNGAVVEDTTDKWMGTGYTVKVTYANDGLIGVVTARPVVAVYDSLTKETTYIQNKDYSDVVTYGLDKITIYNAGVLDGDGNVSKADVNKTLMTGTTHYVRNCYKFVVADQMIIVLQ